MKVYFAGDHAGFELKKKIIEYVRLLGHEVEDLGPFEYVAGDDYTDYVIPLARKVAESSPFVKGSIPRSAGGGILKSSASEDLGASFRKGGISPGLEDSATPFYKGGMEIRGIVVAGSGQGEIIAMNRIKGARAALFCPCNFDLIKASRGHNDSNILAIGARFCTGEEAKKGIQAWLETPFSNEARHVRRLTKIEQMTDNL